MMSYIITVYARAQLYLLNGQCETVRTRRWRHITELRGDDYEAFSRFTRAAAATCFWHFVHTRRAMAADERKNRVKSSCISVFQKDQR